LSAIFKIRSGSLILTFDITDTMLVVIIAAGEIDSVYVSIERHDGRQHGPGRQPVSLSLRYDNRSFFSHGMECRQSLPGMERTSELADQERNPPATRLSLGAR
jgi:hypothetical protein